MLVEQYMYPVHIYKVKFTYSTCYVLACASFCTFRLVYMYRTGNAVNVNLL